MAENTQNQEPSMEEILASIRRIISEDGATVEPTAADAEEFAAAPAPSSAPEEVPVLDLIEEVQDDGSVASLSPEPFVPPPVPPQQPAPVLTSPVLTSTVEHVAYDKSSLLSDTAAQASASAMSSLSRLIGGNVNIYSQPIGAGHNTLEGMVAELLRPILKDWLDTNLPAIVERVVQKEIQKITRDLG